MNSNPDRIMDIADLLEIAHDAMTGPDKKQNSSLKPLSVVLCNPRRVYRAEEPSRGLMVHQLVVDLNSPWLGPGNRFFAWNGIDVNGNLGTWEVVSDPSAEHQYASRGLVCCDLPSTSGGLAIYRSTVPPTGGNVADCYLFTGRAPLRAEKIDTGFHVTWDSNCFAAKVAGSHPRPVTCVGRLPAAAAGWTPSPDQLSEILQLLHCIPILDGEDGIEDSYVTLMSEVYEDAGTEPDVTEAYNDVAPSDGFMKIFLYYTPEAVPGQKVLELLNRVASIPKNLVFIVTELPKDVLRDMCLSSFFIGVLADGGRLIRWNGYSPWRESVLQQDNEMNDDPGQKATRARELIQSMVRRGNVPRLVVCLGCDDDDLINITILSKFLHNFDM